LAALPFYAILNSMSTASDKFDVFTGFTPFSTIGPYRAEDYWQLEEGEPVELIRGRLLVSPCPTPLHQVILGRLYMIFDQIENETDGLCLIAPMDVVLSDDTILQPDLLFVAKERRSIITKHVVGPPDLAVEVLSPGTSRRDKTEKLDLYAKYGVAEYWMIDPSTQVFDFLLLDDLTSGNGRYVIQQQLDDHYRSPRLPEIAIDLATFWAEVERRLPKA